MGKNTVRVPKPKTQGVVLKKMKELFMQSAPEVYNAEGIRSYADGFLHGYAALRSLVNPRPINQKTRDAFMKWATK